LRSCEMVWMVLVCLFWSCPCPIRTDFPAQPAVAFQLVSSHGVRHSLYRPSVGPCVCFAFGVPQFNLLSYFASWPFSSTRRLRFDAGFTRLASWAFKCLLVTFRYVKTDMYSSCTTRIQMDETSHHSYSSTSCSFYIDMEAFS